MTKLHATQLQYPFNGVHRFLVFFLCFAWPIHADDRVKQRVQQEYPAASQRLADSLSGIKGTCILTETFSGETGEVDAIFAVDHGYTKLTMDDPEEGDDPKKITKTVLCSKGNQAFALKKGSTSNDYVVTSAGKNPETIAELDERFGMLLRAPYSAMDESLAALMRSESIVVEDAKEQTKDGVQLVTITLRSKDEPERRGSVVLSPSQGWAVRHSEFQTVGNNQESYKFDAIYGAMSSGVPTLKSVTLQMPTRTYGCVFTQIVHESTDEAEFRMDSYKLPDLLAEPSASRSIMAWALPVAGFTLCGIAIMVWRRKRRKA